MKNPALSFGIILVFAGASQAAILVQDDFSTAGVINGSTLDTSINGSKWSANTGFTSDGSVLKKALNNLGATVSLGGTLASGAGGGTYNLSATIAFAANPTTSTGVWGIGLSQTAGALTSTVTDGGSPWIFIRENGAIEFRALPSNNTLGSISVVPARAGSAVPDVSYNLRLSINTTGVDWVVSAFLATNGGAETQLDINGANAGLTHIYSSGNPTVGFAGITATAPSGIGSLDNYLFEGPLPVPEPSAALLGAIGAFGFCSLRKRRA